MFDAKPSPLGMSRQTEAASDAKIPPINTHAIKVACSNCNLRELCLPLGLKAEELDRIDEIVGIRLKVRRGATLFNNGEKFTALYAIRTGFFKTCIATEDGRDQVTGFQMAGEIIGLDGIVNDHHTCNAVALEDAEVCLMPFDRIEELSREFTSLQRHVHKIMSREIVREHGVMLPRSVWRHSCSTWCSACMPADSRSQNSCCA